MRTLRPLPCLGVPVGLLSGLLLALLVGLGCLVEAPAGSAETRGQGAPGVEASSPTAGNAKIVEAFRRGRSDVWVEGGGEVVHLLRDDLHGSRHQRFLVLVDDDHTVLLSHNIDLAPRIPLQRGDHVRFRGEYEWNDRGGVVHWTHHDPRGRRQGGWVDWQGKRFR